MSSANIMQQMAHGWLELPDPGHAGVIDAKKGGFIELRHGGSTTNETRTITAPTSAGAVLILSSGTLSGSNQVTVTFPDPVGQEGAAESEILFDGSNQAVRLVAVPGNTFASPNNDFRWAAVNNQNATVQ